MTTTLSAPIYEDQHLTIAAGDLRKDDRLSGRMNETIISTKTGPKNLTATIQTSDGRVVTRTIPLAETLVIIRQVETEESQNQRHHERQLQRLKTKADDAVQNYRCLRLGFAELASSDRYLVLKDMVSLIEAQALAHVWGEFDNWCGNDDRDRLEVFRDFVQHMTERIINARQGESRSTSQASNLNDDLELGVWRKFVQEAKWLLA